MGRICYHPCETACNRSLVDESVGINGVERFLGDLATRHGWTLPVAPPTGKRVMVVGAGPGGLSTAYHLARSGHEVTVYEASPKAGGMMRYGIPRYRLPREQLNADIERIAGLGVAIELNARVDDVLRAKKEGRFNAVFLALGAPLPRRLDMPGDASIPVLDALTILRNVELEQPTGIRGRVVVFGGGNTAFDVGRSAVRLGALRATVVAVEARDRLPAHAEEVAAALEEGVELQCQRTVREIRAGGLVLEEMIPGEGEWPTPSGRLE